MRIKFNNLWKLRLNPTVKSILFFEIAVSSSLKYINIVILNFDIFIGWEKYND